MPSSSFSSTATELPAVKRAAFAILFGSVMAVVFSTAQTTEVTDYKIAYSLTKNVWVKDLGGGKAKQLLDDATDPAWSRSGKQIAYVHATATLHQELAVADSTGKNRRTLLSAGHARLRMPSWSPDGKSIAFVREEDGQPNLYLIDVNSLDVKRTTELAKGEAVWRPTWSPDGEQIAYATTGQAGGGIVVRDLKSGTERQITRHTKQERVGGRPVEDADPAWSPDGLWIAFSSNRAGKYGIYVMHPDGSDLRRLLMNSNIDIFHPVWAPDGKRMAFEMEQPQRGRWIVEYNFPYLPRSQYPVEREIQLVDLSTHTTTPFAPGSGSSFGPR